MKFVSGSLLVLVVCLIGSCSTHNPSDSAPSTAADVAATNAEYSNRSDVDRYRAFPLDEVPPDAMAEALEHKRWMRGRAAGSRGDNKRQSLSGTAWRSIGPAPIQTSRGAVTGRVRSVAIDTSDPNRGTFYCGTANGGVWKTTNGGASWIPLTDEQSSLAINSIAIDPQDPDIIYAGTGEYGGGDSYPGSGVLRSTDGGLSWTQLGNLEFGGRRIGKIALDSSLVSDPLTQRVVYVASTGGLFRSIDSGVTWQITWTDSPFRDFSDVVVDPNDQRVVYAARLLPSSTLPAPPVYRSDSYGAPGTWYAVPGQPGQLPEVGYRRPNLAISSTSPATVLLSLHDTRNGRDLKGIWATNDGGDNWTRLTGHPPEFGENGFVASADVAETEPNDTAAAADAMALSQVVEGVISDANDVDMYSVFVGGNELSFEICADRAGSGLNPKLTLLNSDGTPASSIAPDGSTATVQLDSPAGKGVQGSDDERLSFSWSIVEPQKTYIIKVESADGVITGSGEYQLSVIGTSLWCQCDYDQVVAIHPTNPSIMYWGGIRFFRSTDGGTTWNQIQEGRSPPVSGTNWLHADSHAVAIDPADPDFMLVGNDGGVWATVDGGSKWVNLNSNLAITQFYWGISQGHVDPDFVVGGTQDNATVYTRGSQQWIWPESAGGDGGYTAVDPDDASDATWYFSSQGLLIRRTTDDGASAQNRVVGLGRENLDLVSPYVMDPSDSSILIAGGGVKVSEDPDVYENYVYRTTNGGEEWFANSEDFGGRINTLAIAPSNGAVYYAATTNGAVMRTENTGAAWTDISAGLPLRTATDIVVHPSEADTAWITFAGTGAGHIYLTEDGGGSWTDIGSAPHSTVPLPDISTWAVVVDPDFPETIFVGNDVGVFRTTDGGTNWEPFDEGLPNSPVFDLALNLDTGKFRAATHGRGMWELYSGHDDCLERLEIGEGTYTGTTTGASPDGSALCANSSSSNDVWYQITAPYNGTLKLNTCGSSFDTVLSVHQTGCPASGATQLPGACDDDCTSVGGCGVHDSCVEVPVVTNQQYLIRVSGFDGASGDYVLDASFVRPEPSNDDCGAVFLPSEGSYFGWTSQATNDGSSTCGESNSSPDVWYRYTSECNGRLEAEICNATFDAVLSIHDDCPGNGGIEVACSDDCIPPRCSSSDSCLDISTTAGEAHYLRVAGYDGRSGDFTLNLDCIPDNDNCAARTEASAGITSFSTGGATTDGADGDPLCNLGGYTHIENDIWFCHVATCDGLTIIDTCDADFDTKIAVYDGCTCPPPASSLACNDDACGSPSVLQSKVAIESTTGQRRLIRIGGFQGETGSGQLHIQCLANGIMVDGFESGTTSGWSASEPGEEITTTKPGATFTAAHLSVDVP